MIYRWLDIICIIDFFFKGGWEVILFFAFDKGEEISTHTAPGDALVYVLDGETEITIGEEKYTVKKGESIVMPANVPHALMAKERFKMMLIVIFSLS